MGTGTVSDEKIARAVNKVFSFKPADIIGQLDLLRPIYRQTTNYGHFGKSGLPWENTNRAAALRAAVEADRSPSAIRLHAHHAHRRPTAAAQDFQVKDLSLADWGRKEIVVAEHEMPGLMAVRRKFGPAEAAPGRPHHRLAAHDDPDRGPDRDPDRARAPTCAGPPATSSRPRTTRPRRSPRRACRSSPGRARPSRSTGTAPGRPLAIPGGQGPQLVVDDGGDVTLLLHKGYEMEEGSAWVEVALGLARGAGDQGPAQAHPRREPLRLPRNRQGAGAASPRRRPPASTASTSCTSRASSSSRRSTSTTRSPSRSSTISTAAASRWPTA